MAAVEVGGGVGYGRGVDEAGFGGEQAEFVVPVGVVVVEQGLDGLGGEGGVGITAVFRHQVVLQQAKELGGEGLAQLVGRDGGAVAGELVEEKGDVAVVQGDVGFCVIVFV